MAGAMARATRWGDGFTLLEVLIAIVLLATAVVTTAGLVTMAGASVRVARTHTLTALLASDKMEDLRALPWASLVALSPSPAGALQRDEAGYVDYLDGTGRWVGATPVARAVYVRRWSLQPLPEDPDGTLILQVLVVPVAYRGSASVRAAAVPGAVVLVSVRTRKGA